jgi:hypothetical protein
VATGNLSTGGGVLIGAAPFYFLLEQQRASMGKRISKNSAFFARYWLRTRIFCATCSRSSSYPIKQEQRLIQAPLCSIKYANAEHMRDMGLGGQP